MKKLLIVLASLLLMQGIVSAQDTLRQRSNDRTGIQKRDRIHQEDHLMFQDGKLYRMQEGVRKEVRDQVQLKNGAVVKNDGSLQLQNGQRYQLRNGECIDLNGNRYKNENRFNKRIMMTEQQMERSKNRQMKQDRNTGRDRNMNTNRPRTQGNRRGSRS